MWQKYIQDQSDKYADSNRNPWDVKSAFEIRQGSTK